MAASFQDLLRVVSIFLSRPESKPFREPVDWKGLGLTDYTKIVKLPMDLGTVKRKLEQNEYATAEDCAADIRLIWTNCMAYNQDGSDFYHLAAAFAKKFEEVYAQLRRGVDDKTDTERIPTLNERLQLSYDIFKLKNSEMGQVLTMIEKSCPVAINRRAVADEVTVNFDILTPNVFHNVNTFVQNCLNDSKGKKKRSVPGGNTEKAKQQKK